MNIEKNKKVLLIGASGDLGFAVLKMLAHHDIMIGAHCFRNKGRLNSFLKDRHAAKIRIFQSEVSSQKKATQIVKEFVKWAGGIDYLIQLSGNVKAPQNWEVLTQNNWDQDIAVNLSGPFFLAQTAVKYMKKRGGKIILTSTASVPHGGGKMSMAYGVAKAGIECITKGLAKQCAKYNILVNAVAPGFIMTEIHRKKMKRTLKELKERARLVPLKRAGRPEDVAGMVVYLLSSYGDYITGEIVPISGGDWL